MALFNDQYNRMKCNIRERERKRFESPEPTKKEKDHSSILLLFHFIDLTLLSFLLAASSKSPTRSSRRKRTTITEAKGDKQDPTPSTPKNSKKKSTLNKELAALEVPALDVAVGKRRTRSTRKRSDSMYTEHNEYDISDEDMISDAQVEDDHDEDLKAKRATPRRAKRRRQDEDSEEAPSPKPKKRRKKVHEARIHLRLIPAEEEPKVREQIIREEVELLTCDELLVPDKESNVNLQQAKCNVDFEEMFLDFLIFKRVYGHALVPKHFEENKPLGRWCCKIRNWKNKGKSNLTASRERRLNAAGFCWDAKKNPDFWKLQNTCKQGQDRWEDFFGRLLEYKKENGNCIVPKECKGKHRVSTYMSQVASNTVFSHCLHSNFLDGFPRFGRNIA